MLDGSRWIGLTWLVLAAGCGDAEGEPLTAVGSLAGAPSTFVVVVYDDTAVTGYVCDGASQSHWFQGSLTDGAFSLSNEEGTLSGTVTDGAIAGTFTIGGASTAFSATAASGGTSGLWNGGMVIGDTAVSAGVIVRDDGMQRGTVSSRPRGVMAEPMIMPSPMIMPDPMGVTTVTTTAGALSLDQIVSPRDPIVLLRDL